MNFPSHTRAWTGVPSSRGETEVERLYFRHSRACKNITIRQADLASRASWGALARRYASPPAALPDGERGDPTPSGSAIDLLRRRDKQSVDSTGGAPSLWLRQAAFRRGRITARSSSASSAFERDQFRLFCSVSPNSASLTVRFSIFRGVSEPGSQITSTVPSSASR